MKIVANCVVKNEIYWFPYGLESAIRHLDHIFITDTGSDDGTYEVIRDHFIPKYPNKITLLRKTQSKEEFGDKFLLYKNELVDMSREYGADWMLCLDGDEIYYDFYFPKLREKLETLDPIWRMIAVNTRYFVKNLDHVFHIHEDFWHYRFFNLNLKGRWVLPYGYIDWSNPKPRKIERLTLAIEPGMIDMIHTSFLQRSPYDTNAVMRIKRQDDRNTLYLPEKHSFGLPEVFQDKELLEITKNLFVKR